MKLLIYFILVPLIVMLLICINLFFAVHRPDFEKVSAYECGFSPIYGQTRVPFSIRFYLVGILFLLFDLEILLVFPLALILHKVTFYGLWIVLVFFFVLTIGFIFEWFKGALSFTSITADNNK